MPKTENDEYKIKIDDDIRYLYENIDKYEGRLASNISELVFQSINNNDQIQVAGDIIRWTEQRAAQIFTELNRSKRTYSVHFIPQSKTRSEIIKNSYDIEGVGLINNVVVQWPKVLNRKLKKIPRIVCNYVEEEYRRLEENFLEAYQSHNKNLFKGIHPKIRVYLSKHGYEELYNLIIPTITHKEDMRFNYYLDYKSVEKTLKRFKSKTKKLTYSPIELTMSLILGEADHTINKLHKDFSEQQTLHLPTSQFMSANEDTRFFVAESALFLNRELSEYNICHTKNYIFQIGVPRQLEDDLKEVLNDMQPDLARQFKQNISRFEEYKNYFSPAKSSNRFLESLGVFTGSFLGAFAKTYMRQ